MVLLFAEMKVLLLETFHVNLVSSDEAFTYHRLVEELAAQRN